MRTNSHAKVGRTEDFIEYLEVRGRCPSITCILPPPHLHPICPMCGCIGFASAYCMFCLQAQRYEMS